MVDRTPSHVSPARYGLSDDRDEQRLQLLGWWGVGGPAGESRHVLAALARSPDPAAALLGLQRIAEADSSEWCELGAALHTDPVLRGKLFAVLGSSTALTDALVRSSQAWRKLATDAATSEHDYETVLFTALGAGSPTAAESAAGHIEGMGAEREFRAAYLLLLVEIAAADLGHLVEPAIDEPEFATVTRKLTMLADAVLRVGLAAAATDVSGADNAALAIIALGKCGGRELNYVSDVDVVFVCDGDLDVANKLAQETVRLVGSTCFQVDAALRPEGTAGPLVRTVESHESYYCRWARIWEFQALLKARPIAGDAALGRRYMDVVTPLVFAVAERVDFVPEVQRMRRRIENDLSAGTVKRELKLGRGGLRDVEFAVQLLQLVHGRVDTDIRSGNTVDALTRLSAGGYIGRRDGAELTESYRFLRLLEHRLQLRRLRRTHLFPDEANEAELHWLARAAGIGAHGGSAAAMLQREFQRHSTRVRRLHEKFFYRPLLDAVSRVPTDALRLTTDEAERRLAALGYAAADGALEHIKALTAGLSRRVVIQRRLLPVVLDLLAETADPDGGLLAYRRVSEALTETSWYLRLVRDEAAVVERLTAVLGSSRFVPDLLVRAPEVLWLLADSDQLADRSHDEVARSLRTAVARQRSLAPAVATARSLRRHELLRVACADVLGLLGVSAVCAALSNAWLAVLQAVWHAVIRELNGGDTEPPARIAVIGMGRLGGGELGYGSDADVMFVCEPIGSVDGADEQRALAFATRVATTVRDMLGTPSGDPRLEVDAGLRPEGRNGPLVRTLDSYQAYYTRWAGVWEAQALLRACPVAGDVELGQRFLNAVAGIRYPPKGLDESQVRQLRRLKARVEVERLPRGADPTTHTKLGRGGLADVEWTVQLFQLRHTGRFPELRTTKTLEALDGLARAGLVTEDDAESLRAAWLLATRSRNAITLVRGKPSDQLPGYGRDLTALARILGYTVDDDPGEFLDLYRRTTRRAHAVAERLCHEM